MEDTDPNTNFGWEHRRDWRKKHLPGPGQTRDWRAWQASCPWDAYCPSSPGVTTLQGGNYQPGNKDRQSAQQRGGAPLSICPLCSGVRKAARPTLQPLPLGEVAVSKGSFWRWDSPLKVQGKKLVIEQLPQSRPHSPKPLQVPHCPSSKSPWSCFHGRAEITPMWQGLGMLLHVSDP